MKPTQHLDVRLQQFRAEWPVRVAWRTVHQEAPEAFRLAVIGALLMGPAVVATFFATSLSMEFPVAITFPAWLDWARALVIMLALLLVISVWIVALVMLNAPLDARRGMAIARFARERGLRYSRYGFAPERSGIFFAGGRDAPRTRPRTVESEADRPVLYRAEFALWKSAATRFPPLQIAIAHRSAGDKEPRGPRRTFRYLEFQMPRRLPHLVIDSRRNGRLRHLLPETQRLSFEGDFDRYFDVYVPNGYEVDALQLLTPDVMACLVDHGRHWDIEVVDDRVIVASHRAHRRSDRIEYTALLFFAELIRDELGYQVRHYTDPRARHPRASVGPMGARLRMRSTLWATGIVIAVGVCFLALPAVVGWFLDQ